MASLSTSEPPMKRMKASKVKTGEFMSATVYYRCHGSGGSSVSVHDQSLGHGPQNGFNTLNYGKQVMERECWSASQYEKVNKCTATELVHVLQGAGDTVFTAWFKKQDKSLRKIVGFRVGLTDTCFGRTEAIDLEIDSYSHAVKNSAGEVIHSKGEKFAPDITEAEKHKHQKRQIDHRGLEAIIIRNELYHLKSLSKKKLDEMLKDN